MRSSHCRIVITKLHYHLKLIQVLKNHPKFCADRHGMEWSVLGKGMFSEKRPYLNQQVFFNSKQKEQD